MKCVTRLLLLLLLSEMSLADDRRPFSLGTDPVKVDSVVRRTQWWMFTADWCVPCQAARGDFEEWLKRSGWRVDDSETAHIRLIDGDRERTLAQQFNIRGYPTFLLLQNGREVRRFESYPGRDELIRAFLEAGRDAKPIVGTISAGTITGQREHIAQAIEFFRPLLGAGGTLTVMLDRSGGSSALLPISERFSVRTDNPLMMTYSLKNDVLTCRFGEPYPRGRFTFGLPVAQPIAAVSLSVSEVIFELPRAPDVRLRVEP